MIHTRDQSIIEEYYSFLNAENFPCVAARAAITRQQVRCLVVDHMACAKDDMSILHFLYDFVENYRTSPALFHSATIIFRSPGLITEELFDTLLWQRLQSLSDLDAKYFTHDKRVSNDPSSANFSFSIGEEALFIIGLHPSSSRTARRFKYPALAFNPHAQFDQLRNINNYDKMKNIVRKRDLAYSGSVNPMLDDFGESSEVYQYSGRVYDDKWQCPFRSKYTSIENNPST